jgi:hypothetical protein
MCLPAQIGSQPFPAKPRCGGVNFTCDATSVWRLNEEGGPVLAPEVEEGTMAKGYWITFYRSISDSDALAACAKLAGPAVTANGGRLLARGGTVRTYEKGIAQRTIAIEFGAREVD